MKAPCTVNGCTDHARGSQEWCELHYRRALRFGDPATITPHMVARERNRRFWDSVSVKVAREDGPCMEWQGARNQSGYGRNNHSATGETLVPRIAWTLTYGPIPDGLWVLHRCDNPPCARPAHLFLGTPLDNVRDMVSKGRNVRHVGDSNVRTKVPDAAVNGLRARWLAGATAKELALEVGVHPASMSRILRGLRRTEATPITDDLMTDRVSPPRAARRTAGVGRPTPIARRVNEAVKAEHDRRLARSIELYESGLSTTEVGKAVGWDSSTLSRKLRAAGVIMRTTGDYHALPDPAVLAERYLSGVGLRTLATEFGSTMARIAEVIRGTGTEIRRPGRPRVRPIKREAA